MLRCSMKAYTINIKGPTFGNMINIQDEIQEWRFQSTYVGSLAKFKNRHTLSMDPFSSKSDLKNRAVSMFTWSKARRWSQPKLSLQKISMYTYKDAYYVCKFCPFPPDFYFFSQKEKKMLPKVGSSLRVIGTSYSPMEVPIFLSNEGENNFACI